MWIRNATIFVMPVGADAVDPASLTSALEKRPFQHCGGLDWTMAGWIPPADFLNSPVYLARNIAAVTRKREDKVLPASVLRDFVDAKVQDIEEKELRKVGRKEKAALKEQITDDLLPKAFVKTSATSAYLDFQHGYAVVNSGSSNAAESLISAIREAIPPFPCALPRTVIAPRTAMTNWLLAGEAPARFEFNADVMLQDSGEEAEQIKIQRGDLTADDIRQLLASGRQVSQLGLIWREQVSFVLTDALQLKKVKFLDVLQEEASQNGDDKESLYEATVLLMTSTLAELIDDLFEALGGLDSQQASNLGSPVPEQDVVLEEAPWS